MRLKSREIKCVITVIRPFIQADVMMRVRRCAEGMAEGLFFSEGWVHLKLLVPKCWWLGMLRRA